MHFVVCIKQVPNTTKVRIDPETNTLVRAGVESIVNPFDENALEMALVLKEQNPGSKVTAVCMGPPQAADALKECVSRGVDEVLLLCDRAVAGSDTWATSYAIAQAVKSLPEPADLILFGKQAIDGDTAQVGPGVAEHLGLPCITFVRAAKIAEPGRIALERVWEDGWEEIVSPLPAAVTVLKEANVPRLPSLRGKMAAKKLQIPLTTAADIGADPDKIGLKASPTRVVRIFSPPQKTGGEKWTGLSGEEAGAKLAAALKDRNII